MLRFKRYFGSCGTVIALLFLLVSTGYTAEMPDTDWLAYFGTDEDNITEYRITLISPFGPQQFIQRQKPKEIIEFAGIRYRESVILHDSGPFANRISKTFTRVTQDGLYERNEDEKELLLVPRPLELGQTWKNGDKIYKFEKIEDFETFNATILDCAKIIVQSEGGDENHKARELIDIKYYERGKGLIYKSGTNGPLSITKILSEYAARTDRP